MSVDAAELEHRLAVANQMIEILEKRVRQADREASEARASRDSYRVKIFTLVAAVKAQGFTLAEEG